MNVSVASIVKWSQHARSAKKTRHVRTAASSSDMIGIALFVEIGARCVVILEDESQLDRCDSRACGKGLVSSLEPFFQDQLVQRQLPMVWPCVKRTSASRKKPMIGAIVYRSVPFAHLLIRAWE